MHACTRVYWCVYAPNLTHLSIICAAQAMRAACALEELYESPGPIQLSGPSAASVCATIAGDQRLGPDTPSTFGRRGGLIMFCCFSSLRLLRNSSLLYCVALSASCRICADLVRRQTRGSPPAGEAGRPWAAPPRLVTFRALDRGFRGVFIGGFHCSRKQTNTNNANSPIFEFAKVAPKLDKSHPGSLLCNCLAF